MQDPACRWRWAVQPLVAIVAAAILALGLSGSRFFDRPERDAIQQAVIDHFERASLPPSGLREQML